MNADQFKPQPPVERSPSWAQQALTTPPAGESAAPPSHDCYITADGHTIQECAVCLVDASHDDAIDALRPLRAVTAVVGTPVCRDHLRHLDAAIAARQVNASVLDLASRMAQGLT